MERRAVRRGLDEELVADVERDRAAADVLGEVEAVGERAGAVGEAPDAAARLGELRAAGVGQPRRLVVRP
jgi:hypothetical protein